MAVNWTGSYAITGLGSGTPTGVTSTTLTNTNATFPTSPSLVNWTIRVLTGVGTGSTAVITSNTSTVLTFSGGWSSTQPTTGSTYELVAIIANGDAVTGALTFGNNCITEIANNAVVTVSSAVAVTFNGTCIVRWNKTETTYATIQWANRTTSTMGAWTGLNLNGASLSGGGINWIKIMDAATALTIAPGSATGTGSGIGPLWVDACLNSVWTSSGTLDQNKVWSGIYAANCKSANLGYATGGSSFSEIFQRCWIEKSFSSICTFASNASTIQMLRDSVNLCLQNQQMDNVGGSSKFNIVQDNYYSGTEQNDGAILMGNSTGTGTVNYQMQRNVINSSRSGFGGGSSSLGVFKSAFNDWIKDRWTAFQCINITNSTSYGTSTSDNDYMSGTNGGCLENIDTSASTTSTATPHQYSVLTATRTNAKSVRNRPLVIDNVVVGTPTDKSVAVNFDCQNGAVSGQGSSSVTSDSASGQTVLSTTTTTGFEVNELIEIGYGTARYETARIASISAGTSLTLTANLAFSHTAAQADTIKKQLRHFGLPFVRYGTSSGSYNMQTEIPQESETRGLLFAGFKTTYNGTALSWNRLGHSLTLNNLYPSTTYYIQACAYTPHGELLTSTETSFTTAADTLYSDPGVANVRLATTYSFNGSSNRTGTARIPAIANVKIGYAYDSSDSLTGTYDGSDRYTDPLEANVKSGVTYTFNTVLKTGIYVLAVIILSTVLQFPTDRFGKMGGM